jgi:hypothetical protein
MIEKTKKIMNKRHKRGGVRTPDLGVVRAT